MTLRSFAQNFEDVLLWRALQHVSAGCYVDVGAGHPEHHSVTKLFYDAGWSGINIEPVRAHADALTKERPRDVTVQAAVSSQDAPTVDLTVVVDWDELSTISATRAEELSSEGRSLVTESVPVVRLDKLLIQHDVQEVQFLKVDVEGAEIDVLRTLDLTQTRPWIAVVEVLSGGSPLSTRPAIRELLEQHRYTHCYFDGLNDFYVADEHAERLLPSFDTPVNVTDDFVAVSDSDHVMVDLIGSRLGLEPPVQADEVLQRVEAVLRDRISFETRSIELAGIEDRIAELTAVTVRQEEAIRSWQMRSEALEQTSFERERMIAWYAAEVSSDRGRWHAEKNAMAEQLASHSASIGALRETEVRLNDVLASTSWRSTVLLRAIKRPRLYLRKLIQR